MITKPKKTFFFLKVEKLICDDWTGTIFISKFYPSKASCQLWCATDELQDIAETVFREHTTEKEIDLPFDCEAYDIEEDWKEPEVQKYAKKVKEWLLQTDDQDSLCGDGTLFWEIVEREFVEG
jgi:hypothetical protein